MKFEDRKNTYDSLEIYARCSGETQGAVSGNTYYWIRVCLSSLKELLVEKLSLSTNRSPQITV